MIPRHEGVLQRRHEHVSLQPPDEQLLAGGLVVAVASDHVGEHEGVAVEVHGQEGSHKGGQAVVEVPVGVLVNHTDEYRQVLGPDIEEDSKIGNSISI